MTEPAQLPPLGRHYVEQLRGWSCVLCAVPVPPGTKPLAETPARYGDYRFTYRPTACPNCGPRIPRPVQLPELEVDPTDHTAGGTP
ncbi:hypothetical protein [Streptomyces anthocyanicus]|uniref:hypothetical protein n=1 Tax=Streptomyces anthocyanicus TaxID=68174 RepID=UPI003628003C